MREVLSGSGAEAQQPEAGFTFFPVDERQSLRIGRLLMALGTSLLVCVALAFCAFLDLLPWTVAVQGTAGIVTLALLFYLLFRTGLNLRFADPSLTTEQMGAAILFLAYIMYHASQAREAFTLFYPVAMLFGVLRLTARRLFVLALLALCAHGTVLHLSYRNDPGMDVKAALTEFVVLMVVLPWFAVMGGYVNRLRLRLSDSHRALREAFGRIEQLAIRDELTGAYNRRFLMETLARERSRADRLSATFCVCVIDLDHFKSINDAHGHAAGDAVLRQLPAVAASSLRSNDVFGRYGGEEFLAILPDTDLQGARTVAERMRAAIETTAFPGIGRQVTLTAGIAERRKGEDPAALLARADRALYAGKAQGRNRVSG
jgi:diguanylate cyclase (GGDEF)-like protein